MKRIQHMGIVVCIALLFVIVFQFVFFISYITLQKNEFRKKIINENTEQAQELRMLSSDVFVNKPGLEWKEKGKELVIYGVYHEVISIHYAGTQALVRVIADKTENDLFMSYFELHKKNDKGLHCFLSLILGLHFEDTGTSIRYFNKSAHITWHPETGKATVHGHLNAELKPPLSFFS